VSLPDVRENQSPIRLLKTVTNFASGGTEGQVHNIARFIDRDRFDLRFSCLNKKGVFLSEVEQWGIPVAEYPIRSFFNPSTGWQQLRLARYMRSEKIQISHSYNFYSNLFAIPAARLAGVPLVLASIRDRGVYLTPMQKRIQKNVCMMADRILVNADSIRDWLLEQDFPPQKIVVIKNGIDLSLYENPTGAPDVRAEFGIPATAPVVMMLSRLDPQKGIEDLLRAAALIHTNHPEVHFMIVGSKIISRNGEYIADSDYPNQLMRLAACCGIADQVTLAGHRRDIPALLAQATIAVLPSHSEGLSNALLESMAAGLPLVATRVGGSPEIVRDGINGLLVPPKDPAALAEALMTILRDPALAQRFSLASLQMSRDKYSMTAMLNSTQTLYCSELQQRQSNRSVRRKIA